MEKQTRPMEEEDLREFFELVKTVSAFGHGQVTVVITSGRVHSQVASFSTKPVDGVYAPIGLEIPKRNSR